MEYIKLIRLLLSKYICPVIARFLLYIYTNQTICVISGVDFIGNSFSITNGARQGGVMSPLLFTVYIDELLTRLSCSHAGSYCGDKFHGAYGYTDDAIILAPSLRSLDQLLNICSNYAIEF